MRGLRAGLAALILAATPAAALADDTFLTPPGPLAAHAPIRLTFGSGVFPALDAGGLPGQIARVEARAADTPLTATMDAAWPLRLTLDWPEVVPLHQNGIVVAVDLHPLDVEIGPDGIERYLEEIGAPPDVAAAARAAVVRNGRMLEARTWRLKLMACVAACDGLDPARLSGSTLEFTAADESWRLTRDGRPLVAQSVFAVSGQDRRRLTTDRLGRVLIPKDMTGPVLLTAVVLTPPTTPGGRFTSEGASLTLDRSVR